MSSTATHSIQVDALTVKAAIAGVEVRLTKDVSSFLDVDLHVVVWLHAAKVDTREAGVESGSKAMTHMANTGFGL